jgi:DNA-binding NtrC family response regulator
MQTRTELVMVVHSAPGIIHMLREVIESAGFLVMTVPMEGMHDEALAAVIQRHQPQVVLFDIPWPFDRNLERFRRLSSGVDLPAGTWLPMCTSDRFAEVLRAEGWRPITKPFDIDEVMELVARSIEQVTGRPPEDEASWRLSRTTARSGGR